MRRLWNVMYRCLVRQSFRQRKRKEWTVRWKQMSCKSVHGGDISFKSYKKKLQIIQWSYGALQNNARSWDVANWEGFLTACVSTKEKKNKIIQPIPLEVDQKGWPCWVPCEASYVPPLQGDIAFHSSLTCLICLDWIPARRTKRKCEPNQFIWEE